MQKINQYCVAIGWMAGLLLCHNGAAVEEPLLMPITSESITKASQLAVRVIEKAGDAAGAVNVFEEAGVLTILQTKPPNIPAEVYADVLLNYARALFQLPERYYEAEPIVLQMLKYSPDQYSGYLLVADINQKRYRATKEVIYGQRAKQYYRQYIEHLTAKKLQTVLPERVVNTAYGAENLDVCSFVKRLLSEEEYILYNLFKAETSLEILTHDPGGSLLTSEFGITFKEFADTDSVPVYRSLVDIDNDGKSEIRYWKKLQNNSCMRNLFYKVEAGKNQLMTNVLLDQFFKAERLCGESDLTFIRYKNTNYFLEKRQLNATSLKYSIYQLNSEASWQNLCTLDMQTSVFADVKSDCEASVCKRIATISESIIAANGEGGIEQRIDDRSEPLAFDDAVMQDETLRKYASSQHMFLVDLDNDGENELITRLWEKADESESPRFSYRLFERIEGHWKWRPLPPVPLSTDKAAAPLNEETWFFVEPYEEKNYIVTYKAFQKTQGVQQKMFYSMSVYFLQANHLQQLGRIQISAQVKQD